MTQHEFDQEVTRVYWASFGVQNHAVPAEDTRCEGAELIGLCGVMTAPADITNWDRTRAVCSWCSWQVRNGAYLLIPRP